MQILHIPVVISLSIGLVAATALGAFQGLLVAKSAINPFIITLALLSIYKGLATVITKGDSFQNLPNSFRSINKIKILGTFPLTLIAAITICILALLLFKYLPAGKKLEACGASPRAAVFTGIHLSRTIIIGHALSGLFVGMAAIVQMTKFGAAQLAIGSDWMMPSFVVTVLGGTLLSGGKVSVTGTFFGAILMVVLNNALVLWKVSPFAFQIFIGGILLLAYEIDRIRHIMINRQSDLG